MQEFLDDLILQDIQSQLCFDSDLIHSLNGIHKVQHEWLG